MNNYWLNKRQERNSKLIQIALDGKTDLAWVMLSNSIHEWHHVCIMTEKDASISVYIDGVHQGRFRREDGKSLDEEINNT
jgi:hypothetical protein